MISEKLTDYFKAAAAKYLSFVDVDSSKSNQHEFGGLVAAGFKDYLGAPHKGEKNTFPCLMVYLSDENEFPTMTEDTVTWYDSRYKNPKRSPEYRLYYKDNEVTDLLNPKDFMLIAQRKNNALLIIFAGLYC